MSQVGFTVIRDNKEHMGILTALPTRFAARKNTKGPGITARAF